MGLQNKSQKKNPGPYFIFSDHTVITNKSWDLCTYTNTSDALQQNHISFWWDKNTNISVMIFETSNRDLPPVPKDQSNQGIVLPLLHTLQFFQITLPPENKVYTVWDACEKATQAYPLLYFHGIPLPRVSWASIVLKRARLKRRMLKQEQILRIWLSWDQGTQGFAKSIEQH